MARMTQKEIAEHLGLSERRVRDVLKNIEMDQANNTIDEIRLAYIEDLRQKAAGRNDDLLSAARTRDTLASAQLKELDLAEKFGQVIWAADLAPVVDAFAVGTQAQVMSAGNKIIQAMESKFDIDVDDEAILGPLRTALQSVAGSAGELVEGVLPQPEKAIT